MRSRSVSSQTTRLADAPDPSSISQASKSLVGTYRLPGAPTIGSDIDPPAGTWNSASSPAAPLENGPTKMVVPPSLIKREYTYRPEPEKVIPDRPARVVDCSEPAGTEPVAQATLAGTGGTSTVTAKVVRSIESSPIWSGVAGWAASTVTPVVLPVRSPSHDRNACTSTGRRTGVNSVNGPVSRTRSPLASTTNRITNPSASGQLARLTTLSISVSALVLLSMIWTVDVPNASSAVEVKLQV